MDFERPVTHVAPVGQPNSVCQLTERLFPAYTVDGGKVHLAGCEVQDRLFLRLTFGPSDSPQTTYLDSRGDPVPDDLLDRLGLREATRLERPPVDAAAEIRRLAEIGVRRATESLDLVAPCLEAEVTAIWCKYVEGKLRFSVGDFTADLPFAGWARTLAPPPYACPHTGRETFHVAITDDGRFLAADAVAACAVTGRRLAVDELAVCSYTGKRVAPDQVERCPLTGQLVLRTEIVACESCRQRVSPATLERGVCAACRQVRPVSKADPRLARLLTEHPTLDRWRTWRLSETETVYVLVAAGLVKRLLVVVDKESLDIKVLATGNRLTRAWRQVESQQIQFVLRE